MPYMSRASAASLRSIMLQEHEHVAGWSTHFWQRPKHQLTLLGSYGRNTSLSFIDFDEFMVLQNGRSIQVMQYF